MLLCPNCRARVPEDAERCVRCGSDVRVAYVAPEGPARRRMPRRAGTRRIAPRWRRVLLGAVVAAGAALLGLSLSSGRKSAPSRSGTPDQGTVPDLTTGRAPTPLGNSYLCPLGYPIRAYEASGLFYPPNHPSPPASTVRPARCFAGEEQARSSGYRKAATPSGAFEAAGVYLLPVDLMDQCVAAADVLGYPVPCPGYLPSPAPGVTMPGCGQYGAFSLPTRTKCVLPAGIFYFEEAGFAIPPGFAPAGAGSPAADLIVTAFPVGAPRANTELPFDLACPQSNQEPKASVSVSLDEKRRQVEAELRYCPTSAALPFGGHLLVRWADGGVVYQVALSGNQPGHRDLLLRLASLLRLVRVE